MFDVAAAINVCLSAGYYEHALYLARKFGYHEWFVLFLDFYSLTKFHI